MSDEPLDDTDPDDVGAVLPPPEDSSEAQKQLWQLLATSSTDAAQLTAGGGPAVVSILRSALDAESDVVVPRELGFHERRLPARGVLVLPAGAPGQHGSGDGQKPVRHRSVRKLPGMS